MEITASSSRWLYLHLHPSIILARVGYHLILQGSNEMERLSTKPVSVQAITQKRKGDYEKQYMAYVNCGVL